MLEALEEHLRTLVHNHTMPLALDGNQTDNSAEGRCIGAVPQFRGELRMSVTAGQESSGAKSKKWRFDQFQQLDNANYISNTSIGEGSESL